MKKLLRPHCIEMEKIKGSRFIAEAWPVTTVDDVGFALSQIRQKRSGASHICYGFRLSPSNFKYSDDGEPRNSAGFPILQRLEALDIVSCLCTVTRYYGGVKLGIGGLIRAYGSSASILLSECEFEECVQKIRLSFCYDYRDTSSVNSILASFPDIEYTSEYGELVVITAFVSPQDADSFFEQLQNKTSGRINIITND